MTDQVRAALATITDELTGLHANEEATVASLASATAKGDKVMEVVMVENLDWVRSELVKIRRAVKQITRDFDFE